MRCSNSPTPLILSALLVGTSVWPCQDHAPASKRRRCIGHKPVAGTAASSVGAVVPQVCRLRLLQQQQQKSTQNRLSSQLFALGNRHHECHCRSRFHPASSSKSAVSSDAVPTLVTSTSTTTNIVSSLPSTTHSSSDASIATRATISTVDVESAALVAHTTTSSITTQFAGGVVAGGGGGGEQPVLGTPLPISVTTATKGSGGVLEYGQCILFESQCNTMCSYGVFSMDCVDGGVCLCHNDDPNDTETGAEVNGDDKTTKSTSHAAHQLSVWGVSALSLPALAALVVTAAFF
ncbi:hypothetical protein BX661DRAFT_177459 [Kickxella alabastrina]|uniref:uncharacterized protein n=1 Tax=Kickxella alabastrina TaxID=61397 RepID=UPI00221F9A8C|nr:uncharacterized protein BX661DRAFT_177459 [Kickxella alabastrina]KAI7833744.1 hypothetical protein BX661DRAFT_177459 [Kickxella alabastrina]